MKKVEKTLEAPCYAEINEKCSVSHSGPRQSPIEPTGPAVLPRTS